jgi:hypothetical protein
MSRLVAFVFVTFALGCGAVAIPEAPGQRPSTRAPAHAATVLFVFGAPDDPPPALQVLPRPWHTLVEPMATGVDVLDQEGQLLGRLQNRTWLEVERPPGPQTFYAVPTGWVPDCLLEPCPPGDAQVGLLRAQLEPGRVYAVWIGHGLLRGAFAVGTSCRGWDEFTNTIPSHFHTRDLVAVRTGGWTEATSVLEHPHARAMRVAPRGLRHPYADEARRAAESRVGHCWDARLSTLDPQDGLVELW